jgi:hypothetical protein
MPGFSQEDVDNGAVELTCGMVTHAQREEYKRVNPTLHVIGRGHKYAERKY